MNPSNRFTKAYDELIDLGLPPRLVLLYGKLQFHAGKDGKCYPTHATLAREMRLKSRRQIINLLHALRKLKLIRWSFSSHFNRYEVLAPDVKWISHLVCNGFHTSGVKSISHRKESSSKKRQNKRTSSPTPSPGPMQKPGAGTGAKPKAGGFDDDEPKPERTPEAEFRERLAARHGPSFDADTCLRNVGRQIGKVTGLSLADFLVLDAEKSTGQNFRNPNGYYVHLAKELVQAAKEQAARATHAKPVVEPPSEGRCTVCGGSGRVKDGYCDCRMGRDLAVAERRKAKPSETLPDCLRVFGLTRESTLDDLQAAYRREAKTAHPDQGGTAEGFRALRQSREDAELLLLRNVRREPKSETKAARKGAA